jgi:hypothetical protein
MATSGVVGLMMITSPGTRDPFRIGPAGFYRVRVCRRKPANVFRLQFWPASPPEPPRWLVRDEPPIRSHDHEATRYGAAASDVVVAILWARECGVAPTPQWLTQRLLLSPETLDEILGYAARAGLVVTDDPGSFAVAPRRPVRQPFRPVAVRPATPRPETPRPETP